jgi:hypothetical protein
MKKVMLYFLKTIQIMKGFIQEMKIKDMVEKVLFYNLKEEEECVLEDSCNETR